MWHSRSTRMYPRRAQTNNSCASAAFNLSASIAQWLTGASVVSGPYVAGQGTALGRRGRVFVEPGSDGQIWIEGRTVTHVTGTLRLHEPSGIHSAAVPTFSERLTQVRNRELHAAATSQRNDAGRKKTVHLARPTIARTSARRTTGTPIKR